MAQGALSRLVVRAAVVVIVLGAGWVAELRAGGSGGLLVLDWAVGAAFGAVAIGFADGAGPAIATAATWYAGTLAGTPGWTGSIGTALVLAYRAPALHALARPARDRWLFLPVLIGYPIVLLPSSVAGPVTIGLGLLVGVLTVVRSGDGRPRLVRGALVVALAAVWAGAGPLSWSTTTRLVVLDLVLLAGAASLIGRRRPDWGPATDLFIDLGPAPRPAPVSSVLARALGVEGLIVLYRPPDGQWLDEMAVPAAPPPPATQTTATPDGGRIALVGCPPDLFGTPLGRAAVHGAALAVVRTAAIAAVRRRSAQVEAARRRLLEVSDSECREIVARVRAGPLTRIHQAGELLERAGVAEAARLPEEVGRVGAELARLAEGLYPSRVDTAPMAEQVRSVAEILSPPAEVRLDGALDDLSLSLRVLIHYVCSETLTNAARHAPGAAVDVEVRVTDAWLAIVVTDDGPGGASASAGTGLAGLADRAAVLGGGLSVTSPVGGPTAICVRVPLSPI